MARVILRNKIIIIAIIVGIIIFFSTQWRHMQFSYTEANLLPEDHEIHKTYKEGF